MVKKQRKFRLVPLYGNNMKKKKNVKKRKSGSNKTGNRKGKMGGRLRLGLQIVLIRYKICDIEKPEDDQLPKA